MNVKEIVKEYLEKNGFGGLHDDYCGCEINDLFPCDNVCSNCIPGIKVMYADMTYEEQQEYEFSEWIIKDKI